MKVHELLEAQDYQRIADPSLKWLAQYTYENLNKWPGAYIVQDLLQRFPCDAGVIYRGMNFYTKEKYDEFMSQFKGAQTASIEFGSITSWAPTESGAEQFAITQPTYFLNLEVIVADGEMNKAKERMAGYRGIILSTRVTAGAGIDVDKSGVGHESEVILPPGVHTIHVHKLIKKYAHQITDKDVDINQAILNMNIADMKRSSSNTYTLFDYVMHHHISDLNSKARAHLFKLFQPDEGKPIFDSKVDTVSSLGATDSTKVQFHYWTPCYFLFELYKQGVFQAATQKKDIIKLAKQIMREALPVIEEHIIAAERFDGQLIKTIAEIAGMESALDKMIKRTVGPEYRRLEDVGRAINKITDPKEHEKALHNHKETLKQLLSKIPR
jgi:hypothetical protein